MAFVGIADSTGDIELLLFPSTYEQTAWLWEVDKVVYIEGTVNAKDRDGQIVDDVKINVSTAREILLEEAKAYKEKGKTLKPLGEVAAKKSVKNKPTQPDRIFIRIMSTDNTEQLTALKEHIDSNPGKSEVVLVVGPQESKQAIRVPDRTSREDASIDELVKLFGADNVKLS